MGRLYPLGLLQTIELLVMYGIELD